MVVTQGSWAAAVATALAVIHPTLADFVNPLVPDWRGTAASEFFGWESFTSAFGGANDPNYAGTEGGAALFNFTMGALITGTGNLYGGQSPLSVMAVGGLTHKVDAVVFNVATIGTLVSLDSVRLTLADNAGHSTTSSYHFTLLRSEVAAPGGQGVVMTRAFKWQFHGGQEFVPTRFTLEFASQGANMSLDAASFDFHYIPAPGALALLGFAGLNGSRRRRRH